jgi:hypothetical protein
MFSAALVLGIGIFHGSLRDVIMVRVVLMAVMLVLVVVPFLRKHGKPLVETTA